MGRLEKAVQQHVSVDGPVSFFDKHDIEPGVDWSESLEGALGTAQAFIALYSPAYFESEYCGKEWAAFTSRYNEASGRLEQPPVFPVLWVPMGRTIFPKRCVACSTRTAIPARPTGPSGSRA